VHYFKGVLTILPTSAQRSSQQCLLARVKPRVSRRSDRFRNLVSPPSNKRSEVRRKEFYGIKLDAWKVDPNAGPRMTQFSYATD